MSLQSLRWALAGEEATPRLRIPNKLGKWMPVAVLGAYGAFVSFWLLFGDERRVTQLFREDDGYYFMTIARNLVRGLGPTFDTIHETNGFHPLWLACGLTAFFSVVMGLARSWR